jgi:hypothetical protein
MNAERLLNELLREAPMRRAPASLESRVFRELERRAALPWWLRRFARWPAAARVSFVAICCAIAGITLDDGGWSAVAQGLSEAFAAPLSWTHAVAATFGSARDVAASLIQVIPATWLYGGLAAAAALYAALFGLTAVAYRALYLQASTSGGRQ